MFSSGFNQNVNTLFVFLDYWKRSACGLQQGRQLSFHKPVLFLRIAHVPKRRTHVKCPANLTLEEHVISAQVDLRGLTRGLKLLQVSITEFILFISLVADSLSVRDAFWNGRCFDDRRRIGFHFSGVGSHGFLMYFQS